MVPIPKTIKKIITLKTNMQKGVRGVKGKRCSVTLEEGVTVSIMTYGDQDICIKKTEELLSKAQQLMKDIEELLKGCDSTDQIQQDCQASVCEDVDTLIVDGFRFESAASREELRRLSSRAGARGYGGHT